MSGHPTRPQSDLQPGIHRPVSANLENLAKNGQQQRPSSEVLTGHYKSPEAEAIDRWFEDLSYYERTLEQMARAKLDDNFRDELKAIEQWFSVLSDPERTTALYSLLQHTTQVQIRFFITVLQQMAQKDPIAAVVSPGGSAAGIGAGPGSKPWPGGSPAPKGGPGAIGSPVAPAGVLLPKGSHGAPSAGLEGDKIAGEEDSFVGAMPTLTNASRSTAARRIYDRHSAPNADEKYTQLLGDLRTGDSYMVVPDAAASIPGGPMVRPKTPIDDAIASANWSVSSPGAGGPTTSLSPGVPPGLAASAVPGFNALISGPITERTSSLGIPGGIPGSPSTTLPPSSPGVGVGAPVYQRPLSPRPVSPIIVSPPTNPTVTTTSPGRSTQTHPGDGWSHISLGPGVQGGLRAPGSPYAPSDYSDSYDEYGGDSTGDHLSESHRLKGTHKEKGKIPEAVDMEALSDIPSWLRSLRLHKYTPVFEGYNWKDMIKLNDDGLQANGVSALGARRKLLKVFELIKQECDAKGIAY
ncbi:hypothetical protein BC829DRAFT_2062 [Chytridium lagenaria]|nr:hypothetical protein BC829DRAFT_2062 [Chytridium lagenaria]